jgi:hypothetical protein
MQQQQPQQPPAQQSKPATPQAPAQSPAGASSPAPAPAAAPAQPKFNPQAVTPVVQIEATKPTNEVGVADVLMNSIALIGFLIVAALVVGLVTGGIFIAIQRWRDKNSPDSTEPTATRLKLS